MLVPVLVSEVEIGHARAGIGISQIQLWAVTQFCCEIEFRAVEFFLVNANAREQGSTFLGVVAHTQTKNVGLGGRYVDCQVVGVRKLVVQIGGVAFLDLVGDFIEAACATEDVYGLFDVVLRVPFSVLKAAFATKPAAIAFAHIVDGDATQEHGFLLQVHGMRRMELLAHRMPRRGIHRLLDGQKLVVEAAGTLVATPNQSVNGLWRETQHSEPTNVGDDVDIAHLAVFHTLGTGAVDDQTGK